MPKPCPPLHVYPICNGRYAVSRLDGEKVIDLCAWGEALHQQVLAKLRATYILHSSVVEFQDYHLEEQLRLLEKSDRSLRAS